MESNELLPKYFAPSAATHIDPPVDSFLTSLRTRKRHLGPGRAAQGPKAWLLACPDAKQLT
jgi:hypothetical protein